MSKITNHPESYTGLPYLTHITIDGDEILAVVDYVNKGTVHYYDVEQLDFDRASTFLLAVEEYQVTKAREWPLSVFMSANQLTPMMQDAYHMVDLDSVKSIVGPAPSNWFHSARVDWRRKDLITGETTRSKHRRSRDEIELAEKAKTSRAEQARIRREQEALNKIKRQQDTIKQRLANKEAKLEARKVKVASMQNEKVRKRAEVRLAKELAAFAQEKKRSLNN